LSDGFRSIGRRIDHTDHTRLAMLSGGTVVPDWLGVVDGDGKDIWVGSASCWVVATEKTFGLVQRLTGQSE